MNKVIVCPCKVKFRQGGWNRKMQWIRKWTHGIAVAAGEYNVLVWVEGDPRVGVHDIQLTSVPKSAVEVVK